jgi:D-alanyl-D-alanine carboxypeptidase
LDEGVGAFASINAMQGYRPNPVLVYALKAMRAANATQAMPPLPPPNPPSKIEKAEEYTGVFTSPDGRRMEFKAQGDRLFLVHKGQQLQLETTTGPGFLIQHSDFDKFLISFGRDKGEKGKITEVSYGADWYFNKQYAGPRDFTRRTEWDAFVGHYRNDSPWIGSLRVVLRKGGIWLDGILPLDPVDVNTFKLADSPYNPEWIRFLDVVNGKSMHLKLSGEDYWRVDAK